MNKSGVEKAILYIKDYTQGVYARARSERSIRLMESVNVLIEHHNQLEAKRDEFVNTIKLRDLLLQETLGSFADYNMMDIAKRVPAEYYVRRITEHYMNVMPIARRFYFAVQDYKLLEECQLGLLRERELLDYMRERNVSEEFIKTAEERIEGYREQIEKLL